MKNHSIRFALLFLFCIAVVKAQTPATTADRAFSKLQSLTGDWVGKDDHGMPAKTSFRKIAGSTAMMETLTMSGMDEMVTLYSIDGDSISLIHYCPTKNQPHMQATPPSGEIQDLVFEFKDARNLPTPATGHEQKLVLHFDDATHITESWTWRRDGKDTVFVYHLARKPAPGRAAKP